MRYFKDMSVGDTLEFVIAGVSGGSEEKRFTLTMMEKRGRRARLAIECIQNVEVEFVTIHSANSAVLAQ